MKNSFVLRLLCASFVFALSLCIGDQFFHVRNGVLVYHVGPFVTGQSVWVWPIFFAAAVSFVICGIGFAWKCPPVSPARALVNGMLAMGAYYASGVFHDARQDLLIAVFVLVWIVRLVLQKQYAFRTMLASLTLALCAAPMEGFVSYLGLFDYVQQDVARVPWWLFAAYLHAAPTVLDLSRWVQNVEPKPALHMKGALG
ncbi:MAG: hypothetical protein Q7U28_17880 [Aquabacterium sp.]|nr:hypothetical protein [Aquabacterium sp.]